MAREVNAAFLNVVFGVAPAIMKEQLDDKLEAFIRSTSPELLMAESDAHMAGERRPSMGSRDRSEKISSNQGRPTTYNEEDM